MSGPIYAALSRSRAFRRRLRLPSFTEVVSKAITKRADALAANVTANNTLYAELDATYRRYDDYCKLPWWKRLIAYIRGTVPVDPYR